MAERALPGAVVAALPAGADPAVAAALGIAGLAGWMPLAWRMPVREGDRVLVLGATGTVGAGRGSGGEAARRRPRRRGRPGSRRPRTGTRARCGRGRWRSTATSASRRMSSIRSAASRSNGPSLPPHPGARIVQLGQAAGATATLPSAAIRGKHLEVYGFSDFAVPADILAEHYQRLVAHAVAGEIRVDARAGQPRRDRGRLGPLPASTSSRRRRARLPVDTFEEAGNDRACDPAHRAAARTHAHQPLDRRQDRRRARPAGRARSTTPRSGSSRRGRPRDGRGGRRRRRGREGRLPGLARHLARQARGADVQRSASSCTNAARRSPGSSRPSTARCSPTRWARSRAGSR